MTTTAALEKGQVITVSAIVQGYESKDGRERVLLDIPDFHSQHDTKVDVTPEQKLAMPAGVAVNLTLKRENCASEKYRDRPYGWYYGLESIGSASAGPEPAPAPQDAASAAPAPPTPPYQAPNPDPAARVGVTVLSRCLARRYRQAWPRQSQNVSASTTDAWTD